MLLYNILIFIFMIIGFPVIVFIVLLSSKRRKTFLFRLGAVSFHKKIKQNKQKKRIWIHALSVGEVISSIPIVYEMKNSFKDKEIYFSASTKTGFETANQKLKNDVCQIFFFPYDFIFSVKHVIKQVKPDFAVIVETDIWPNFLHEMNKQKIPVFLVNTRLSQKSFKGYKQLLFFTKPIFQKFSKICTQSMADAQRFRSLGVEYNNIIITGNVKFDQSAENISQHELKAIQKSMNISPECKIIVAGSTHEGEENILLQAFLDLKNSISNLCMIIVPRNPDRAEFVCNLFRNYKQQAFKLSEIEQNTYKHEPDVIVVDRIGILKKLYSLADLAFVGGSMIDFGGHNPLEPAAFAKPVLYGPYMSDFSEIAQMLLKSGGAVQVKDAQTFYVAALEFLIHKNRADICGKNGFKVFIDNKGAVDKTIKVIKQYLAAI